MTVIEPNFAVEPLVNSPDGLVSADPFKMQAAD
jgi:hypothetical protein